MIGRQLLNYEILEKLCAGGHGEVYRALDTRLSRLVVSKVLPHELTDNERNLKRFERGAQLISSLDHPNVCTVYGFDEVEGLHLMIMQLIEGLDTAIRAVKQGAFDYTFKTFAQQRGIAVVFDGSKEEIGLMYVSEGLDLTRAFIMEFNRRTQEAFRPLQNERYDFQNSFVFSD